jgi:hypothetical protein
MAWTKEVKEKRVSQAEDELRRAKVSLGRFDSDRADLTEKLAALTDEEKAKRAKRVAVAQRELDWNLAALVEGEELDDPPAPGTPAK